MEQSSENGEEFLFLVLPNSDTQLEALQKQLQAERKLSIFGQLIPGIAHNINNPLSVIIGRLQLLQLKNPQLGELTAIQKQATTIKNVIDVLTFKYNKVTKTQSEPVVISTLLQNELDFLQNVPLYKHKIQKLIDLDTNTPPVTGIYADLATAIMTIVYFSIDSMFHASRKFFRLSLSVDETHITIDIADTGTPIDAAEPNDVFIGSVPIKLECIEGCSIDLKLAQELLQKYNGTIAVIKNDESGKQMLMKIPYP
jgi:nitrogen-specific signal transduction histidine kinase